MLTNYKTKKSDDTLQGTITYPTKREVRKIIDSKVPIGRGCVSSQEGTSGTVWYWNPVNSPVKVGSWSHNLPRCFFYIPGGAGFLPATVSTLKCLNLVDWTLEIEKTHQKKVSSPLVLQHQTNKIDPSSPHFTVSRILFLSPEKKPKVQMKMKTIQL